MALGCDGCKQLLLWLRSEVNSFALKSPQADRWHIKSLLKLKIILNNVLFDGSCMVEQGRTSAVGLSEWSPNSGWLAIIKSYHIIIVILLFIGRDSGWKWADCWMVWQGWCRWSWDWLTGSWMARLGTASRLAEVNGELGDDGRFEREEYLACPLWLRGFLLCVFVYLCWW